MSHESLLPYISHEEGEIICEGEDLSRGYKAMLQLIIGKMERGENERFIIAEERSGDEITLTLKLLQFYPPNVLIDHLGLK